MTTSPKILRRNFTRDDAAGEREIFGLQQGLLQVKIIGAFFTRRKRERLRVIFTVRKFADRLFERGPVCFETLHAAWSDAGTP